MQVTVRISSAKFREGTIDGDTTYLRLHNLDMELKGNILQSPALVIQPTRVSDPLILRARTPCVLGGIWWHRASNPGLPVWNPML
ncbi:hypothetical protein TNCV_3772441 [Trichonephila clavipes]|nr:hypothetical protein TNCV_3772441 [Trichonephila clavipes]